jgi:predicted AlkP superfamily phosphohydrolase/phosphomutase
MPKASSAMTSHPRILFLGADACDPALVTEWAAAGHLPYFAELLKTSLRARTRGPAGIYGGSLWPTFVTGMSPGRHRCYCFNQYSPLTYADERFLPDRIAEEPFWLRLDRAGRQVGVLDVPLAPITSVINGFHVAEWGVHDLAGPRARFSSSAVAREVERVAGVAPVRDCEGRRPTVGDFRRLREALMRQARLRTELAAHFLGKQPWDFFACVFSESHCAGHQMWHLHDASHPDHAPEIARHLGADPLLDVYRAIDRGIAALASHAGEGTIIVVWCSHGMGPHYDATFLLDVVLQRLEGPKRAVSPPPGPSMARRLYRRIPLAWRRPLARVPQAILRRAAIRRVAADRRGRRYFAIPDNYEQGAIRINLIGRDAHGRVRPGTEYAGVLAHLREALLELENAETGEPLVTGFQYPQTLHPGPYSSDLPDMTVEWNRSRPVRKIRSPRVGVIEGVFPDARTGDHKPEGLLFVLHPGIVSRELDRIIDAIDLAPTITQLLGVPHEGFDGSPVPEILVR